MYARIPVLKQPSVVFMFYAEEAVVSSEGDGEDADTIVIGSRQPR